MDSSVYTVAEQIDDTSAQRPHLVILGAGASVAACPNGDKWGTKLPVMFNVIETLAALPVISMSQASNGKVVTSKTCTATFASFQSSLDSHQMSGAMPTEGRRGHAVCRVALNPIVASTPLGRFIEMRQQQQTRPIDC